MEKRKISGSLILTVTCLISLLITSIGLCEDKLGNSESYQKALKLAARLSPEEKVGQLFLITFDGSEIGEESEIYQLISKYYVGGVVLKSENGNFADPEHAIQNTYDLISGLQTIEWDTKNELGVSTDNNFINDFIPLYIGISQSGGSFPYDQMISGVTSTPSQMAIGATWNTSVAEDIGELIGSELGSLGINLFFGPSLDVLDIIYSKGKENLGVRTFGGDPYWVGEMGAAYINGIHNGSANKIAVIAKNFPGRGSSDRLPEEEVATVRKSLEQLKLIELAPFFRVTGPIDSEANSIVNGLLSSHIRYQGFQGNIRATTKPISFDQNAMELLMDLSPLDTWREAGGILVSDDLGSQAVYKFYNPSGQFIDARQVVRNAFLAGNDLLYMDQLISTGDEDRVATYRKTMDLFVQKYKEDQAFAEKVDSSLIRILTQKYELYNEFTLEKVIPNSYKLSNLGGGSEIVFQVALQAATLVNPSQNQINESFPLPPQFGERILIFTDDQTVQQCDGCRPQDIFPVNGLQTSILNLYGPSGSGQIGENQIISYSLDDLHDYINNPFNRPEVEENLSKAKWVIFALREINSEQPSSYALQNLLAENPLVLRDKNVLVFSFDVPYYFDATEISAFSAFYCLYSKLPSFVEVAARIIFQETTPQGASPVSISGIAYDLITVMTPAPDQIIPLSVDEDAAQSIMDEEGSEQINGELESTLPVFKLGDILPVKTGIIVDHNNNPVPDGTVVRFTMNEEGINTSIQQIESVTENGVAKASVALQNAGMHEIKVVSEPALSSQILVLDISEEEAIVSAIFPTQIPTLEESLNGDEAVTVSPEIDLEEKNNKVSEWFVATAFSWILGVVAFYLLHNYYLIEDRIRISGSSIVGGLFNTAWFIFDFPGSYPRYSFNGYIKLCFYVLIGVLIGGAIGWIYIQILQYRSKKK
jgi:beta-N-acetylhexosaminidase